MNDRGMKKWQPFYSLGDFNKIVVELSKSKQKEKFKTLSDDQIYEINKKLKEINKQVVLTYFNNGFYNQISGKIEKIDLLNKCLFINNKKIFLKNIYNIK